MRTFPQPRQATTQRWQRRQMKPHCRGCYTVPQVPTSSPPWDMYHAMYHLYPAGYLAFSGLSSAAKWVRRTRTPRCHDRFHSAGPVAWLGWCREATVLATPRQSPVNAAIFQIPFFYVDIHSRTVHRYVAKQLWLSNCLLSVLDWVFFRLPICPFYHETTCHISYAHAHAILIPLILMAT